MARLYDAFSNVWENFQKAKRYRARKSSYWQDRDMWGYIGVEDMDVGFRLAKKSFVGGLFFLACLAYGLTTFTSGDAEVFTGSGTVRGECILVRLDCWWEGGDPSMLFSLLVVTDGLDFTDDEVVSLALALNLRGW